MTPLPTGRRSTTVLLLLAGAAAGSLIAAGLAGATPIQWRDILDPSAGGPAAQILWRVRLPRVCLGFLAGAALATGGMAFQALFRNALATPYTLGVSSGAALGAAIYIRAGLSFQFGAVSGLPLAALLGAVITMSLLYALMLSRAVASTATLLLAGVAVSFSLTSLMLFTQYLGDVTTAFRIGQWLMGGLEVVGFTSILQILPFVVGGGLMVLWLTPTLDLLQAGDKAAAVRGVAVQRTKLLLFGAVSLMIGGVVAICGPIGFVGMIVPHVGRLLLGGKHRPLMVFSLIGGGAFLVACDTVARTAMAPIEIPVGIITALLGGPFFLSLLLHRHRFGGPG